MAQKKKPPKEELAAGPFGWQRILGALPKVEAVEGVTGEGVSKPLITRALGKKWITKIPQTGNSYAMEQLARDLIGGQVVKSLGFDVPERKIMRFDPRNLEGLDEALKGSSFDVPQLTPKELKKVRTALSVEKVPHALQFEGRDYRTSPFPRESVEANQIDKVLSLLWPSDYWLGNTDRRQFVLNTNPQAPLAERTRVRPIDWGLTTSFNAAQLAQHPRYPQDVNAGRKYLDFGGFPQRYHSAMNEIGSSARYKTGFPPAVPSEVKEGLMQEAEKIAQYPKGQLEDIVYRTPQSWVTQQGKQTSKEEANEYLKALIDYMDQRAKTLPENVRRFLAGEKYSTGGRR